MAADGSGLKRLTDHPAYEGAPRFSPDGRHVFFEGEREGRAQIYRLDLASGDVERVTETGTRKLGPACSPDGVELAYMEKGLIWWQVSLRELSSGETRVVSRGGGSCRPAWSPDGSLLAYVSTKGTPKAEIWLREMVGARKGESWQLSTRPDAHNYDPAFAPDGLALALASTRVRGAREQWDLFVVDLNGRNRVRLTDTEGNERFPDWRPAPEPE